MIRRAAVVVPAEPPPMDPTNVSDPQYYHRVVDCQWGCPAHTNVPEYIRLIALGRYTDAYMLNRYSNVFPGILGRTCDRPWSRRSFAWFLVTCATSLAAPAVS
jgi:hypothetical protein